MRKFLPGFVFVITTIISTDLLYSQSSAINSEWGAYGRDAGGSRYSDLDQVNDKNVNQLKPSWVFNTRELKNYAGTDAISIAAFEATPIMIGGKLYFSTPSCRVFALDAETGEQLWMYDPKVDLHKDYSEITSRGVSAWPAPTAAGNNDAQIIFIGTIDGRLIALDARTGVPISTFGNKGTVDIQQGIGRDSALHHRQP
jgi:quinoprotein glucose dehydrogenase